MADVFGDIANELLEYAGLTLDQIDQIESVFNSLSPSIQKTFLKKYRTFTLEEFIKSGWKYFYPFFYTKKSSKLSAAGIGNGEIMILLGVGNSVSRGLQHGDIFIRRPYKGDIIEVKELDVGNQFRIGKIGNAIDSHFMKNIMNLLSILERLKNVDKYFEDLYHLYFDVDTKKCFKELNTNMINLIYEGIKQIAKKNIKETDKLIVSINDIKFWASAKDQQTKDEIKNGIRIGKTLKIFANETINEDNRDYNIKLLKCCPYIYSPESLIINLRQIVINFFKHIDGVFIFNNRDPKPQEIIYKDDENLTYLRQIVTSRITQGNFKLQYIKDYEKLKKYKFLEDQWTI